MTRDASNDAATVADGLHHDVLTAIEGHDFPRVVATLEALAVVDLDRAARLYGDIKSALAFAKLMGRLAGEGDD